MIQKKTEQILKGHEFPMVGWIPCLALIQGGRDLVLTQLDIQDFVDTLRKVLPPLSYGWG